jgi:cytochrome P450
MMISGIRAELSTFVKLAGYLPIPTIQNALKLSERLDAYGRAAIENQKEYLNSSKDTVSTSLFSKFLDSTKNNELSIPQISAEASNLIIAGSDTTAVSLTYLVWTLHRPQHRDIKEKLLVELDSLPMDASLADVSNLRYLRMVVDESLRLYGAAPGSLPRVCPPKGAKLGGYFMPGGTIVSTQAYTLHRDGTIFEDPER